MLLFVFSDFGTMTVSRVFVRFADTTSLQQLIDIASLFRILMVILMATSCYIYQNQSLIVIKDESLVTFPLRLMEDLPQPFSLPNTFCRSRFIQQHLSTATETFVENPSRMWSSFLTPLTRWDAARFLKIAHEPMIRYPQQQYKYLLSTTSPITVDTCPNVDRVIQESEEAHPFLPLFPFLVQSVATLLLYSVPTRLLPPTCEGILVLASYILNTFCFLWSAKQLFLMTKLIIDRTCVLHTGGSQQDRKNTSTMQSNTLSDQWARRVLLLYIINPASVFFVSTYSESLGAALIFTGHHWMLQYQFNATKSTTSLFLTYILWYLGCFVRSNGTINAGFLFLFGIGGILKYSTQTIFRSTVYMTLVVGSILLVFGSIGLHNYMAYRNFCVIDRSVNNDEVISTDLTDCQFLYEHQTPDWCHNGPYFNVYSYVQRKYWNVGFLRYYEWKQSPNFLLAAPVLCFSIIAVVNWIRISWKRYPIASGGKYSQPLLRLVQWAILALMHFVDDDMPSLESSDMDQVEMVLLGHPKLLGNYAVLGASTILGLTMAHVQISTRMIFCTCPAIYWFLLVKISNHSRLGNAVLYWSMLYIVLGIIMHPNWLPWT